MDNLGKLELESIPEDEEQTIYVNTKDGSGSPWNSANRKPSFFQETLLMNSHEDEP